MQVPSNVPSRSDDAAQSCLETAALVERLMLRLKIDVNDADTVCLYTLDSRCDQRQPDTLSLPGRMHNYVEKHSVTHPIAENSAPCHELAGIVEPAHCSPVALQSGGIVFIQATPADSFA